MSELIKLQNRVSEAFRKGQSDLSDDPHFDPDSEENPEDEAHSKSRRQLEGFNHEQDRMLRYWLAGGGLIASAAVLATGNSEGLIIIAMVLAGIGLVSLLYSLGQGLGSRQDKNAAKANPAERPERIEDQRWQNNESAALLSAIHDALGDIAIRRNLGGTILQANNTFRDLVGDRTPEGKTCQQLGIRFKPGLVQHSYDVELDTGGSRRVFLWHDVVARDPVLGDLVVQSIARDVTDERQMAQDQEEARRLAEAASENKSRLIATVAHEIRTPLSGLLGMGNLLAGTQLAPDQANYLDGIRQSGTALIHLVEDLLDFSTLEAGRFTLRPRKQDIRTLMESVAEMLASRAHEKGIEIGTHVSANIPDILGLDPARLRQVLYNVAGNAVKFTETGGILISADLDGIDLVITVRDSGPGMNDAEMARIFNEFEQGDIAGARDKGVGLGLAISARILNEAGGKLSVSSKSGIGSTFEIRLPVDCPVDARKREPELAQSRVLLLAPAGPASQAVSAIITSLGGVARQVESASAAAAIIEALAPTDIIVDHRLEDDYEAGLAGHAVLSSGSCRRILMLPPESRPGEMIGTSFHAWLIRPLRERSLVDVLLGRMKGLEPREALNDNFPTLDSTLAEDHAPSAAGLSILVGEDEPVNGLIVQAILERAGHRVKLVQDFDRLRDSLSERHDLIITDMSMPGGRGDRFVAALRQSETEQGRVPVPVIVLTADTTDETRRTLLQGGASLVLAKPADSAILSGAVARLANQRLDS